MEVILQEVGEAMGLPSFFAVEFFTPDLEGYVLHTNQGGGTEDEPGE